MDPLSEEHAFVEYARSRIGSVRAADGDTSEATTMSLLYDGFKRDRYFDGAEFAGKSSTEYKRFCVDILKHGNHRRYAAVKGMLGSIEDEDQKRIFAEALEKLRTGYDWVEAGNAPYIYDISTNNQN
jgi:hypothetical protein